MASADTPLLCARCFKVLTPGSGDWYHVEINAVADPTMPKVSAEELEQRDLRSEIETLLQQMADVPAHQLHSGVARHLTLAFCRHCYLIWIEDPAAGQPGP